MRIWVAFQDDSPPHAAYASEELLNKGEARPCYVKELDLIETPGDVQEQQIEAAASVNPRS